MNLESINENKKWVKVNCVEDRFLFGWKISTTFTARGCKIELELEKKLSRWAWQEGIKAVVSLLNT